MMKAVIIDDEFYFRKNLRNDPVWARFDIEICGEASNGADGIEIVKKVRPDLVLVDLNMPVMDGIEFISAVRSLGLPGKIIILSGYDSFNCARRAMQLGVRHYLLKPVQEKELYETVLNVVTEITREQADSREQDRLKEINRRYSSIVREQMTGKLLLTKHAAESESGLLSDCMEIGLFRQYGNYYVAAASFTNSDAVRISASAELIGFVSSRIQISESKEHPEKISFSYPAPDIEPFAFVLSVSACVKADEVTAVFEKISLLIYSEFRIKAMFSVFGPEHRLSDITLLYHQASGMLTFHSEGRNLPGHADMGAVCGSLSANDALSGQIISAATGVQIISGLRSRNRNRLAGLLEKIQAEADREQIPRQRERKIIFFLLNCGTKYAAEIGMEDYTSHLSEITGTVFGTNRFGDSLQIILKEYLRLIGGTGNKQNTGSPIVEQAIAYINTHFRESSLSIEDISREVFSNYTYLCCIFKKETGETINRYILKTRIQCALALMDKGETSISNIAELSGFSSANYFCRCFRKEFDITPTEYMGKNRER